MKNLIETLTAAQGGDREAMGALWEGVQRYAFKIANKYKGYAELDDLQQVAYIGLHKAVTNYDAEKGDFLPYMGKAIERNIQRYITEMGAPIHAKRQAAEVKRYKADYYKAHGHSPQRAQICQALGIDPKKLRELELLAVFLQPTSTDKPLNEEGAGTIGDCIADTADDIAEAERAADRDRMAATLWELIDECGNKAIMEKLYIDNMSIQETAAAIGQRPDKVTAEKNKTLRTLRQPMNARRIKPYYTEYLQGLYIRGSLARFKSSGMSEVESIVYKQLCDK